ncbi:DUF3987 domain-containing protein [Adhaeribacter terreus]|uniref:DUF3987 domain-containing protein n=1 Tax=Adhaeribacter terreus TaxID=529703 RepID=A0ABW0EEH7_9BACT
MNDNKEAEEKPSDVNINTNHQPISNSGNEKLTDLGQDKDAVQANNENSFSMTNLELGRTPVIPSEVYDKLPKFLEKNCLIFDTEREKDVFLTGALTILSGCLNSVMGVYGQKNVYPNLNCFIIAPPASGKGTFVYAKILGNALHDKLVEESQKQKRKYDAVLRQTEPPKQLDLFENGKPPFKILFIPGNSSSSAIINHLVEGDGKGIFCETEADTLANSINQDWGNFSDLLRKAFHHEDISLSRKGNDVYSSIKNPRLSVALTGTPEQVLGIIPSAENGLFSRFIFYSFKVKPIWRSVAPKPGQQNLTEYFNLQSLEVLKMAEYLEDHPTHFNLTAKQWAELDKQFTTWTEEVNDLLGDEAVGTVFRLGLIQFRIAMILSAIRKYENKLKDLDLLCVDDDFKTSSILVEVYKEHALLMFSKLPQRGNISKRMINQFFDALPSKFKREDAVNIGQRVEIMPRTVDKYLNELLLSNKLKRSKLGIYNK